MMITKEEFLEKEEFYAGEINAGKVFVYPTDTIYGIGCNATNAKAVVKIREIKQKDEKPFSVIVPSKDWILENCVVSDFGREYLDKLPGKFTLILKLKKNVNIAKKELVGEVDTIGVRMPDNWFAEFLSRHGLVFVTTSVNISGEKPIAQVSELNEEIAGGVDYFIDDGLLDSRPSTLIDLSKEKVKIVTR
ncbi:MAG: L-threonylcarbamoyladenylate synthase [archaeon]